MCFQHTRRIATALQQLLFAVVMRAPDAQLFLTGGRAGLARLDALHNDGGATVVLPRTGRGGVVVALTVWH